MKKRIEAFRDGPKDEGSCGFCAMSKDAGDTHCRICGRELNESEGSECDDLCRMPRGTE